MRAPASLGIHSAIGLERVRMFTSKIIIQMEDKNIITMTGNREGWNRNKMSGSRKSNEPKVLSEVLDEYFQSDEPLAVAFRKWNEKREAAAKAEEKRESSRLFSEVFPHTEPCVDLKLFTCSPGRMLLGEYLDGIITRVDEDEFCFVQNEPLKKKVKSVRRNPHIYRGRCINVVRDDDGMMRPTFNHPHYTERFTFQDFCREAAEELQMLAGLVEEG